MSHTKLQLITTSSCFEVRKNCKHFVTLTKKHKTSLLLSIKIFLTMYTVCEAAAEEILIAGTTFLFQNFLSVTNEIV